MLVNGGYQKNNRPSKRTGTVLHLTANLASKWPARVNDLLIVISFLVLLSYGLFSTGIIGGDSLTARLEATLISAILAVVGLFYGIVVFRILAKKAPKLSATLTIMLLPTVTGALIIGTGGFESPYSLLWAIVGLVIGVFGYLPLALIWIATGALFILNQLGVGQIDDAGVWLTNFILLQIPLVSSGLFWFKMGSSKVEKGTIDLLSNSLEGERRKADIIINAIADGVIVISQTAPTIGQITLINPAAQDTLGWTWEEALSIDYKPVMNLRNEKGIEVDKSEDPFTAVAATKESITRSDLSIHTKSKKIIDISLAVSPIKNPDGDVTAVIGVFRDVSAERREQKQRADFISTASHEMRTPVAAIEGYLALAMNVKVAKIDSKAREYLGKAIESSRHLGKLFQDLLTSAKAEDGRLTNHPKVTNIGEMIEKLTGDLRFSAEKKGLLVDLNIGDGSSSKEVISPIYYAHVDPERIREVITNIFDNAVKYTEEGRIVISYSGTPDRITIAIADTGAGIPQEDISHLFQKFYRVDTSTTQQIGGTGLGLFITKKIIELYGGRIWVESTVGQGSVFYISLSRIDNAKAEEMKRSEAAVATPLSEVQRQEV